MKCFLPLLLWMCLINSASAHTDSLSYFHSLAQNICSDFSLAGDDAVVLWQELSSATSSNSLLITGGVVAGTGLAFTVDEGLRTNLQKGHTENLNQISSTVREYGGTYSVIGSSVGIYVVGLLTESDDIRTTGRLMTEALMISGTVNVSLKVLLGRGRPYLNVGSDKFKPLNFLNDYNSLPSGHTTVAFTVSTVLADQIDRWWATVGLYAIASATGVSRIYDDKHWLSDVILGASIGYLSGKFITTTNKNRQSKFTSGFRVYPSLSGVGCSYRF